MGIRENLQGLMSAKGVSDYALAKATGVPQPTIFRILKGQSRDPKTATVKPIAEYFGVSVEEMRGTAMDFKNRTGRFRALSEDALDLLAAFERLPPERQQAYKDFLFMEVFALEHFPWLQRGRPGRESYADYEKKMGELSRRAESAKVKK